MYYKYFYILGILCEKKCPQNVYVEKKNICSCLLLKFERKHFLILVFCPVTHMERKYLLNS